MMRRRIFLWMGLGVLFLTLASPGAALAGKTYRVTKGDTLSAIAKKTGVTVVALKAANNLTGSNLKPLQILVIPLPAATEAAVKTKSAATPADAPAAARKAKPSSPSPEGRFYRVAKGDTLSRIAQKTGVSVAELRALNHLPGNKLKIGQRLALTGRMQPEGAPAQEEALANPEEEEDDNGIAPETVRTERVMRQNERTELLGKWNSPEEPKLLVKVAMGFLGAPYRLGGSSVRGMDCSAFVKKIYEFFNIDLPRTAFEQAHIGLRVARSDLVEGDLLFFNTRRKLGHVGIYIGNDQFVHASSRNRGVRVDNLNTPYYEKRFVTAVRLKECDAGL
mgnify:CR=1 FL=1